MPYIPRWFQPSEIVGLDNKLVMMLDAARTYSLVPFHITSGFRTEAQNAAIGGKPNSAHLRGLAADLRCADSQTRFLMMKGLLAAGFVRIEVSPLHLHADCDPSLPQGVIFLGPDS